jgi:hypothetical protein
MKEQTPFIAMSPQVCKLQMKSNVNLLGVNVDVPQKLYQTRK